MQESEAEMKKPTTMYAIWETDAESGYYALYESIEDAVSSCGTENAEVFKAEFKRLGVFKRAVSVVRVPRKLKPKKAKSR